ncbi:hypothetical protein DIPPA_20696 [Diplonema papillatum]|nr:hypothetical protein DIPPA_35795 [Diplonema papillatum]KAJ9437759.1 hypothetical protein DIPPA_07875 [Diplonema papillatum]KAJ9438223.1 hypothetical protein DIPPA_20696 [Diplonema papillatum]
MRLPLQATVRTVVRIAGKNESLSQCLAACDAGLKKHRRRSGQRVHLLNVGADFEDELSAVDWKVPTVGRIHRAGVLADAPETWRFEYRSDFASVTEIEVPAESQLTVSLVSQETGSIPPLPLAFPSFRAEGGPERPPKPAKTLQQLRAAGGTLSALLLSTRSFPSGDLAGLLRRTHDMFPRGRLILHSANAAGDKVFSNIDRSGKKGVRLLANGVAGLLMHEAPAAAAKKAGKKPAPDQNLLAAVVRSYNAGIDAAGLIAADTASWAALFGSRAAFEMPSQPATVAEVGRTFAAARDASLRVPKGRARKPAAQRLAVPAELPVLPLNEFRVWPGDTQFMMRARSPMKLKVFQTCLTQKNTPLVVFPHVPAAAGQGAGPAPCDRHELIGIVCQPAFATTEALPTTYMRFLALNRVSVNLRKGRAGEFGARFHECTPVFDDVPVGTPDMVRDHIRDLSGLLREHGVPAPQFYDEAGALCIPDELASFLLVSSARKGFGEFSAADMTSLLTFRSTLARLKLLKTLLLQRIEKYKSLNARGE